MPSVSFHGSVVIEYKFQREIEAEEEEIDAIRITGLDISRMNDKRQLILLSVIATANAAATVTNPTPIGLLLLSGLVAHALAAN